LSAMASSSYYRDPERPEEYLSRHYERLPNSPGAIRILKLRPSTFDNLQIDCSLIIPGLDPEGNAIMPKRYEALSWSWGRAEKTQYIRITQGKEDDEATYAKSVTPNLFSALRALRHPTHSRYLWGDAICIDQDNFGERNHQVEQMDKIYGNAYSVCIWLGDANESSKIAIDFIKDEVMKLQNFDQLIESPASSGKWGALLDLMQRDWFSRRWVVQEIALARRALIYCGTDKISWNKFAVAVELFVEVETATHRLSEVMRNEVKTNFVPLLFEYVAELGASLLVDATGKLFPDYRVEEQEEDNFPFKIERKLDSDAETKTENHTLVEQAQSNSRSKGKDQRANQTPLLSLEYLVSSLAVFDVTVPHDTIYAMLAISKDTTPTAGISRQKSPSQAQGSLEIFMQRKRYKVDYKLPYVDVCREFIDFCITQSLLVDKSRALDVICRPWATEEKTLEARRHAEINAKQRRKREEAESQRLENERRRKYGTVLLESPKTPPEEDSAEESDIEESQYVKLPSWVPQLSNSSHGMFSQPGINGNKMSRANADPLVGLPSTTQKNYAAAETKSVDMKSLKFRKRHTLHHYSMYVKGFVLDTIERTSELSRNGQIPEEWPEIAGWPVVEKDEPPDAFWRTLVANRGKDGKSPPVYYARACKESFSKGGYRGGAVDTTGLISYERNSVVAQFCRRVQAVTWNRAMVKTKSEKLGLVGKNIRAGDLVCIFYGCSVPVILRRSKRKTGEEFEKEMEWELEFLTDTLRSYVERWQKRVRGHRLRKEEAKRKFYAWEVEKCKVWLEKNIKNQDWTLKLNKELKEALQLDEDITKARKVMEDAESAYKQEKEKAARKLAKEERDTQKWKDHQEMVDESKKAAERAQAEFELAKWMFRKEHLTKDWFALVGKERTLHDRARTAQKQYQEAKRAQKEEDEKEEDETDAIQELKGKADAACKETDKFRTEYSNRLAKAKGVWELEGKAHAAQEKYEQARAGRNPEDRKKVAKKLEEAENARRSYETKRADRIYYIRLFHPLPDAAAAAGSALNEKPAPEWTVEKMMRKFNEFKQDQIRLEIETAKEKKREKAIPDVDWQSFELFLKYGRRWLRKFVRLRKERARKRMEHHMDNMESELEKGSGHNGGSQSHPQVTIPLRHRRYAYAPDWTVGKYGKPSSVNEPSPGTQTNVAMTQKPPPESQPPTASRPTSSSDQSSGVHEVSGVNAGPNGFQTHENGQMDGINAFTQEKITDLFHDDSDETDWEDEAWKNATRELYKELRQLEKDYEACNPKTPKDKWTDDDWKGYLDRQNKLKECKRTKKTDWKDANWELHMKREKAKKKKCPVERKGGKIHIENGYARKVLNEKGSIRRILTEKAAEKYDKKIRKNFRKKLQEDGFWSYQFLGECYIHGMMDGEAMAHQNGNDQKDTLPSTIFELR
jgi:hypothetical protein